MHGQEYIQLDFYCKIWYINYILKKYEIIKLRHIKMENATVN